ncbi:cubilin-like [Pseudophryne corroboree]|uniref:cubilin-like n=1 Tax=Pseudophryne corroboree TaxID=495146 RepID=UPI003081FE6C
MTDILLDAVTCLPTGTYYSFVHGAVIKKVYDGETSDARLLATLCGSQLPGVITSTQSIMFVRLRSDHSGQHKGFSARFSEACGSTITTASIGGVISSPLYPAKYPNNQNCTWIIQAQDPFNHVTISFTDFETEDSRNCSKDFVEILDGNNYESPSKGHYCGNLIPHPVTSFSNALVLKFVSDDYTSGKGFHATYSASTSACGGVLHMDTGEFNSPSYPENYPANTECVWNILSSPGNRLMLSFISFSLQMSENCSLDYVEIREANETGIFLGRFCGNTLPSNVSSIIGHILWIKFVSDGSISDSGLRATFSHLFGNNIEGTYGQIASPLWPRQYPHHSNYVWRINVESGRIIEIRILEMDIEGHTTCSSDKLRIYDGPDIHYHVIGTYCGVMEPPSLFSSGSSATVQFTSDSTIRKKGFLLEWTAIDISPGPVPNITQGDNNLAPELAVVCGREAPGPIRSSGDSMFLVFSSDTSVSGGGFNASYHKSCGGYLHANRGLITSPNYPENYAPSQNCTWHVVVTAGFTVAVHFEQTFEIQNNDAACHSGDYIEWASSPSHGNWSSLDQVFTHRCDISAFSNSPF